MTSTQKIEELSRICTGSELIYKTTSDASNFSCCAANKMLVRVQQVSTTSPIVFPAIIPLKPPCVYTIRVSWTGISSGGSSVAITTLGIYTQFVSGGAVVSTANPLANLQNAPNAGSNVVLTKNASSDSLDLTLTIAMVGTATSNVECEVWAAASF